MAKYKKTAKDKAWDRERIKLQSEIQEWIMKCGEKEAVIQGQIDQITILENEIAYLRAAVEELTKGEMTVKEVLVKMRKQAELSDMVKFLMNGSNRLILK